MSAAPGRISVQTGVIARSGAATPRAEPDSERPPAGAWWRDDGVVREAGAVIRRVGQAIVMMFLALLACVLGVAMAWGVGGDVLRGLGVWPAAAGRSSGLGPALLWIAVGAPVPVMTLGLAWYAVVLLGGSTRVRLDRGVVEVSTGAGALRWRTKMDAGEAVGVSASVRMVQGEGGTQTVRQVSIERREAASVRFGGLLSDERRSWMRVAVACMLGVPERSDADDDLDDDDSEASE